MAHRGRPVSSRIEDVALVHAYAAISMSIRRSTIHWRYPSRRLTRSPGSQIAESGAIKTTVSGRGQGRAYHPALSLSALPRLPPDAVCPATQSGHLLLTYVLSATAACGVAFSPDSCLLASAGEDGDSAAVALSLRLTEQP